ncbi:Hypothetical protein PHPALM_15790, partial [Phytophthora palmivora]
MRINLPRNCFRMRWQQLQLFVRCASSSSHNWRQVVADFQLKASDPTASLVAKDVASAIHVCTQSDRTREALDVIRRGEKRGVTAPLTSHVQICCSWARKGQADRAMAMMPQLCEQFGEQFQLQTENQSNVYDPLLSVFKLQGDWRSTHAAIAQMHDLGVTPTLRAFRVLMLTAAKARRKDTLITTVKFVENKFPKVWTDVATLTAMCQALVNVDEYQRVMEIYRQLDDEWIQQEASTMLVNQFLLAAIRNGDSKWNKRANHKSLLDMRLATDIFHRMQKAQKAVPDDFTFAIYMMELEKRGEWAKVLELFNVTLDAQTYNQNALNNDLKKPVINALSCSTVIRALHKLHAANQSDLDSKQGTGNSKGPSSLPRRSKEQQRKLKQDLSVVLKQIRTVDLRNIGHASTLIDTLDDFKLFTPARQTFKRILDEGIIQKTPWRL